MIKSILLTSGFAAFLTLSACGPKGEQGQQGLNGVPGIQGPQGEQGLPGEQAPPTPYTPIGLINPCGDAPGIADEVFILMANGTLVASYSADSTGTNTRFVVLPPGNYVTTDGDGCSFTLTETGEITNESKHY